jgi:hypothetical protein
MNADLLSVVAAGVAAFVVLDIGCYAWLRSETVHGHRLLPAQPVAKHAHKRSLPALGRRSLR